MFENSYLKLFIFFTITDKWNGRHKVDDLENIENEQIEAVIDDFWAIMERTEKAVADKISSILRPTT